jgi:hypothetical protein
LILPLRIGLTSARRWLSAELAGSRELAAIEGLALRLPDAMSAIGFEVRLAESESAVDFGTVIHAADAGREILRGSIDSQAADTLATSWPARPRAFLRRWCDPTSSLYEGVTRVFLEFDMSTAAVDPPVPCLFATLDELAWARDPESLLSLVDEALRSLIGEEGAAEASGSIRLCATKLPMGSVLLHVGAMLARADCPIRFCGWIPAGLLPAYLDQVGAPIDLPLVKDLCALEPSALTFQLTLVSGVIAPRLDVEWSFRRQPQTEARWENLLRRLMKRNLCSARKCEALLRWPGLSMEESDSSAGHLVTRGISHIKVSARASSDLSGKAYLTLAPLRSFRPPE